MCADSKMTAAEGAVVSQVSVSVSRARCSRHGRCQRSQSACPASGSPPVTATGGSKRQLAETIHELAAALGLDDLTLLGQDVGG